MGSALGRFSRKVARFARVVADKFPLTPLGIGMAVATFFVTRHWGVGRQDLVLLVLGCGVLALIAFAMVLVVVTAIALKLGHRSKSAPMERLLSGVKTATSFSLPALGFVPLVSLRWEWIEPDAVSVEAHIEEGRLVEHVVFRERGEHARAVRRIVVEDVLGFARIAFRAIEPNERTVLPGCPNPLSLPLRQMLGGGDAVSHPSGPPEGDFIEMRRYGPGDPVKRIVWKVFARTRTLMVRMPEKAVSPLPKTLVYLVAGAEDEPAASLVRSTLEAKLLGPSWVFGADGCETSTHGLAESLSMIIRSRSAREEGGGGLERFLKTAEIRSNLLLFAPAKDGPWMPATLRELGKKRVTARVVLVAESIAMPLASKSRLWRWLVSKQESGPMSTPASEVDALARRLRAAGADVYVVERATGRVSTPVLAERRAA